MLFTTSRYFQSSMQDTADRFMRELARKVYVTPTSFLELIKAFKGLLQDKRDEILGAKVVNLSSHLAFICSFYSQESDPFAWLCDDASRIAAFCVPPISLFLVVVTVPMDIPPKYCRRPSCIR